jgi:hypothetical protein
MRGYDADDGMEAILMQTSRENVTLAGTQVPLLRDEQMQPGVLLTGVAMAHVWEVLHVHGPHVFIQKLPAITVPCGLEAHVWAVYGRGQVCSTCQLRKQVITEFLPKREEKARVHVLTPSHALLRPQPYTLYAYLLANGTVQTTATTGGNWDRELPVLPRLSIVWTIPESLRAMVSGRSTEDNRAF